MSLAKSTEVTKPTKVVYPDKIEVLVHYGAGIIRSPMIGAAFLCYLFRPFILPSLVEWFATVDLSFLPQFLVDSLGSAEHTTIRDACFVFSFLFVAHELLYFVGNGFFFLCDKTGMLSSYKLPRTTRMIPSDKLVIQCLVEGTLNHFLAQPATIYLLLLNVTEFDPIFPVDGNALTGSDPSKIVLPYSDMSFCTTALYLCGALTLNHVAFYWAHRLFHVKGLYIPIHKKHHLFIGVVGWAAEFCHPLEQIIANQLPTISFVMILFTKQVGQEVAFMWLIWRLLETYEVHSGYDFSHTFLGKLGLFHGLHARFHDWHHTDNRGSFGFIGMDYVFGTMDSYVECVMTHPETGKISLTENYSVLHDKLKAMRKKETKGREMAKCSG